MSDTAQVTYHQPVYPREPAEQQAFEVAAAYLRENDAWTDPEGNKHLRADLVLEGGGVKGIGLAGATLVLAEAGYTFPRVAGTSAGAIAAALIAAIQRAGKDLGLLKTYLDQLHFQQFMATGHLEHWAERIIGKAPVEAGDLLTHMGLYSGDYLATWLDPILEELGVTTFADLALTQDADPGMSLAGYKQYALVVHTTDLTRGQLARLPWDYDYYGVSPATQTIRAAVRASMSIPFFFTPVTFTSAPALVDLAGPGGTTIPKRYPGGSVTWVDGGMLSNFPIDAFDRADGQAPRWPTIGIKLSAATTTMATDVPCHGTCQEVMRCVHTLLNQWDQYRVDADTAARTIFVDTTGYSATQFDLSLEDQNKLFLSGAKAATAFVVACAQAQGVPRGPRRS